MRWGAAARCTLPAQIPNTHARVSIRAAMLLHHTAPVLRAFIAAQNALCPPNIVLSCATYLLRTRSFSLPAQRKERHTWSPQPALGDRLRHLFLLGMPAFGNCVSCLRHRRKMPPLLSQVSTSGASLDAWNARRSLHPHRSPAQTSANPSFWEQACSLRYANSPRADQRAIVQMFRCYNVRTNSGNGNGRVFVQRKQNKILVCRYE